MADVCCYFQVHQPYRLRAFRVFDIGNGAAYFDDKKNADILKRIAERCYIPTNELLARLITESNGAFKVAMSLSGTLIEQLETHACEALESFRSLVSTGGVELLGETYYHSLASLADPDEFRTQVALHGTLIESLFGERPRVFRNTELIMSDAIAPVVRDLGFTAALAEGAAHVLNWRSPTYVYEAGAAPGLRLLTRHYQLSDDVAFRFSARGWNQWPLRAETYADWLAKTPGDCVNLFMDYETFGEHQWPESGIFEFLARLPHETESRGVKFLQPSELATREPTDRIWFNRPTSWADQERDVSAWLGNRMQHAAHDRAYALRSAVLKTGDATRIEDWRRLTTSDHFYYMATKEHSDAEVHSYFSPYHSPYDAFIRYMNVMQDMQQKSEATVTA
jgi:alpha-amylase